MVINKSTRYLELLNEVRDKKTFFIAPTHVDFSNTHNNKLIKLLDTIMDNFDVMEIKDIIGSSTSVIITMLLGLGYTTREIQHQLHNLVFYKSIKHKNYVPLSVVIKHKTHDLKFKREEREFICKQEDSFLFWAKQKVAEKLEDPLATFADLYRATKTKTILKNIHLLVLNLTTSKLGLLNYQNTPDMPIAIAARICMSFSTAFSVVEIKEIATNKKNIYTDGGITLQHINFNRSAS